MKFNGFTLSEISIGMLLGSLIVVFGFSFLTFLNQSLFIQVKSFERINDIKMIQAIISKNFRIYDPKLTEENTITFSSKTNEIESSLQLYPDSIIYKSGKVQVFNLETNFSYRLIDSNLIDSFQLEFKELNAHTFLTFHKEYNNGFLIHPNND